MIVNKNNIYQDFDKLPFSEYWSSNSKAELKMHKIHAYPAKFSSVVVEKGFLLAAQNGKKIEVVGDIFCGCGTTALEATRHSYNFWGCDINPVATLIAQVKSSQYNDQKISNYHQQIIEIFYDKTWRSIFSQSLPENDRLDYWFSKRHIKELHFLLSSIKAVTSKGPYRKFFLCAFSNILKSCSKWLTKSIKPQIDPEKKPRKVIDSYIQQLDFMMKANLESKKVFKAKKSPHIKNVNFLDLQPSAPFVDLLITSPPYVTSYEYADLHQLSSIWLEYANDYRSLRKGSIGSLYNNQNTVKEISNLNTIGRQIYNELFLWDKSQAKSVARYLLDMQKVIKNAFRLINSNGVSIFVIGNTSYCGVKVDNAKFLSYCLLEEGFQNVRVFKRKIGPKNLSPYSGYSA